MKIESSDQSVTDLLTSGYYVIPRFQRPYSWDQGNIIEFWDDTILGSNEDYFIGSMVVYKISDRKYGVVDGQQRLTTITILLCVIRDVLNAEGLEDLGKGLHRLVERENIDNELEYVLQTESSYPYFQDHIQNQDEPTLKLSIHLEESNLQQAHDTFMELVNNLVAEIKSNSKLRKNKIKEAIKSKLIRIRDVLLSLKLILIRLDDEDDAYIIFETLNTRGKDLALSDLVKNHFTKLLKIKNKSLDQPKEKWAQLREIIEGSKLDLNSDTFIHHYWLSKYEYITSKNIFKEFSKKVNKSNANRELQAMLDDADLYRTIHDPLYRVWNKQESEIQGALKALALFRVRQQVPCVLSLMRLYRDDILSKKQLERALIDIEKFHFQFTAITSQRSSGGISSMYASLARSLSIVSNSQEGALIINDLRIKLRERLPSENEFIALFPEVIFTNKVSKQKTLIKYMLVEIAKHHKASFTSDFNDLTIEHIVPQSQINESDWPSHIVGQLGNLILVTDDVNNKLKNKGFLEKKRILEHEGYVLPDAMINSEAWSQEHIKNHTIEIAKKAYNVIWKI